MKTAFHISLVYSKNSLTMYIHPFVSSIFSAGTGMGIRIETYYRRYTVTYMYTLYWYLSQLTEGKDYAVHLVRTPEPLEDQASSEDEDSASTKKKRRRSQTKPSELALMDEQWVATHAKQVTSKLYHQPICQTIRFDVWSVKNQKIIKLHNAQCHLDNFYFQHILLFLNLEC